MKPEVSVIIAFYNNLDFLKLVFAGFERQNHRQFEVVIADDGSRESVVSALDAIRQKYSFTIQHVWHEDKGWRKTQILNKAIKKAQGDYLIFIDGDCIPHYAFVKEHYDNRSPQTILTGRRVHLSPRLSKRLTEHKVKQGWIEKPWRLFWDSLKKKPTTKNAEKSIYLRNRWLKHKMNGKHKDILGCNVSMHKSDLIALNGFDERYIFPGTGEDTDIYWRSKHANYKFKPVLNLAIQYHLWHKKGDRQNMDKNNLILDETKQRKISKTSFGLEKN
jgi:glycosyltransferase involved in cell wall biosynthesis